MTAIYVIESGATLTAKRQVFELWNQQHLQRRILAKMTSHIVVFQGCDLSPEATALARSYCVPVLFLDARGEYLGRLYLEPGAKYLRQQLQRAEEGEFRQVTAERMVSATLQNRRAFLLSLQGGLCPTVEIALEAIAVFLDEIPCAGIEELRGYLSATNQVYYPALREWLWLRAGTAHFRANTLFRLGHHLLCQIVYGFVLEAGLHPDIAVLHCSDEESLSLVRDLLLEWSVPLLDVPVARFALSLPAVSNGNGGGSDRFLVAFIAAWEQQLATVAGANQTYRQWVAHQVRHYQGCLWGEMCYRPALLKWTPTPMGKAPVRSPIQGQNRAQTPLRLR
jgi:CRISPR-associated endonuclease Cas1